MARGRWRQWPKEKDAGIGVSHSASAFAEVLTRLRNAANAGRPLEKIEQPCKT